MTRVFQGTRAALVAGLLACAARPDSTHGSSFGADSMTTPPPVTATATLRIALNQHLRNVLARSSVAVTPSKVGDAATVFITEEPTDLYYDDPREPGLNFRLPTGRFVAIDQAGGWVYGVHVTPQLRAVPLDEAVAVARHVEQALDATSWRRDGAAPWRAGEDTVRVWAQGTDTELPVARFAAGPAEVRLTLKRTGEPSPSERLRGRTTEAYYVDVGITDLARLDVYESRVLRERRARGAGSTPLPLTVFMADTVPPHGS